MVSDQSKEIARLGDIGMMHSDIGAKHSHSECIKGSIPNRKVMLMT